jgi:sarcosine oxidase subunit gamma
MLIEPAPPRSIAAITTFKNTPPLDLPRLAPNRYLATGPRDANLPAHYSQLLAGQAAVTDQSDQWITFILSGPDTPEILARLVPIDLHPTQFPPGSLAATRAAHLDVRLAHLPDHTYEISVTRSHAQDLEHALDVAL